MGPFAAIIALIVFVVVQARMLSFGSKVGAPEEDGPRNIWQWFWLCFSLVIAMAAAYVVFFALGGDAF